MLSHSILSYCRIYEPTESKQDVRHVRGVDSHLFRAKPRETRFRCPRFVFRPSPFHVVPVISCRPARDPRKRNRGEIITVRGQNFPPFVHLPLLFVIRLIYMRIPTVAICTAASERCQDTASMQRQSCKYLFFLGISSLSPA